MNANQKSISGAVGMGAGGWWIAQIGVDWVDEAVLTAASSDGLYDWDGVVGRYDSEADAREALAEAIADAEASRGSA